MLFFLPTSPVHPTPRRCFSPSPDRLRPEPNIDFIDSPVFNCLHFSRGEKRAASLPAVYMRGIVNYFSAARSANRAIESRAIAQCDQIILSGETKACVWNWLIEHNGRLRQVTRFGKLICEEDRNMPAHLQSLQDGLAAENKYTEYNNRYK